MSVELEIIKCKNMQDMFDNSIPADTRTRNPDNSHCKQYSSHCFTKLTNSTSPAFSYIY